MIPARFPDGTETRAAIEWRVIGYRKLEGYAATFDTPAKIGSFTESIRPGCFRGTLARPRSDVLALVDHDETKLLARQRSGTLRLQEDSRGLMFSLDVPPTTLGNDVLAMAERSDLGGMSFGFRTISDEWPAKDRRELLTCELIEISIVHSFPAYPATSVVVRSGAMSDAFEAARRRRLFMAGL